VEIFSANDASIVVQGVAETRVCYVLMRREERLCDMQGIVTKEFERILKEVFLV
jgi:hypothetical protein